MRKIRTLKKNYEFKNVFDNGKFYAGKQIIVYINKNNLNENAIGIAVSTKVGNAVKRNHIKRLIRENYFKKMKELKSGHNIIFVWNKKNSIKQANYYIIKKDMENIFNKLKLIKDGKK